MFDYFEIFLSHDDHYDYKVDTRLKRGKNKGVAKPNRRKHGDLKRKKGGIHNRFKGKKSRKHSDGTV